MKSTLKKMSLKFMLLSAMFIFIANVQAQSIHFSSDQWPKRWGRAMNNQGMNGELRPLRKTEAGTKKVSRQTWGQKKNEKRYKRSRTPEYYNDSYSRYNEDDLKRRYAVPGSWSNTGGAYYQNYQSMPLMNYPGIYPGAYSGAYPGLYQGAYPGLYHGYGMPGLGFGGPALGFPYSSPYLLAPGLTPMPGLMW